MCTTIRYKGQLIETVGQLRKAIYPAKVVQDGRWAHIQDDQCLCCIDTDASAASIGMVAVPRDGDTMDLTFEAKGET